jgi:hypothetical protein
MRKSGQSVNAKDLNLYILNYLLVNGYRKSYEQFASFLGQSTNLKLLMNHKEKLASENSTPAEIARSQVGRVRSGSFGRRESDVALNRKPSLIRLETSMQKENDEVLKLFAIRSSSLIRPPRLNTQRVHRRGS